MSVSRHLHIYMQSPLPPLAVSVPPTSLSSCPSGSCLSPSLIDTTHAIVTKYMVKIIWIFTKSVLRTTISHKADAKLDLTGWTALRGITSCVGYHASVLLATNFLNTAATETFKAPWTGSIEARGDFASVLSNKKQPYRRGTLTLMQQEISFKVCNSGQDSNPAWVSPSIIQKHVMHGSRRTN